MLSPRKTTWGIIGACFLAFLYVSEAKAFSTSFETAEGYTTGEVRGQDIWGYPVASGMHDVTAGARHTGEMALEMSNDSELNGPIEAYFATSSTYTQCFAYKAEATSFYQSNVISTGKRVGSGTCGNFALDTIVRVWNGTSYVDIEEPYYAITPNNWMNFCLSWNDTENWMEYWVSNGFVEATYRANYSPTSGGCAKVQLNTGMTTGENNRVFFDSFASVPMAQSEDWDFSAIEWVYPQDGWDVNADVGSTTSWTLNYDISDDDFSDGGYLISVVYSGPDFISFQDMEEISSSTSVTTWQVERTHPFEYGKWTAKASLVGFQNCLSGGGQYDWSCDWVELAFTDQIFFNVTATGTDIFHNRYERPAGFYTATTTAEEDEETDLIGRVVGRLTNVFPLSIAKQIWQTFQLAKTRQGTTTAMITLQDLTNDDADAILGATDPTLLSPALLASNSTLWTETVFPFMEDVVYVIGFIFLLFLLWPKSKSIDLGGHQVMPGQQIDVRRGPTNYVSGRTVSANGVIDLRRGYTATPIRRGWFGRYK